MLGLMIKDLHFIKKQGNIILLMVFLGVILLMDSDNYFFMYETYSIVFGGMIVLNTINYDNYDNGYAYLFTLPVTPGLYVAEKYLLAILGSGAGGVLAGGMAVIMQGDAGLWEHLGASLGAWIGILLAMSFMLPLYLKYGVEKSRILTIVWVVVLTVFMSIFKQFKDAIPLQVEQMFYMIAKMNGVKLLLIGTILTAAVFLLSMAISTRIMQKKEY